MPSDVPVCPPLPIYPHGRRDERSRMLPGDHDAPRARYGRPARRHARRGALGGLRPGCGAGGEHLSVAGAGRTGDGVVLSPENDARPRARSHGAAPRAPSVRDARDRYGGDRRRRSRLPAVDCGVGGRPRHPEHDYRTTTHAGCITAPDPVRSAASTESRSHITSMTLRRELPKVRRSCAESRRSFTGRF